MIKIRNIGTNKQLSKYVRKITVFESRDNFKYKQKLTPSAFTYLSYNNKDIPKSIFRNESLRPKESLQIAGPKLSDKIFVEYNSQLSQILLEFTASGFYYLFQSSPSQLTNKITPLKNFIDPEIYKQLVIELKESDNIDEQILLIEEFLIDKSRQALPFINYIENALQIIEENKGHTAINELVETINIGKRQFNRKFQEVVGVSPKSYSKIVQLHYIIGLMQSKKYNSMQDISYWAEFYDQSHFANRFKELTGFTPNEFIKSDKHIALKYFSDLN